MPGKSCLVLAMKIKKTHTSLEKYRRPLLQGLSHAKIEIIVHATFDQGDHINGLKHVIHDA